MRGGLEGDGELGVWGFLLGEEAAEVVGGEVAGGVGGEFAGGDEVFGALEDDSHFPKVVGCEAAEFTRSDDHLGGSEADAGDAEEDFVVGGVDVDGEMVGVS